MALEILTNKKTNSGKLFSKKGLKKFVGIENGCYICSPLNGQISLKNGQENQERFEKIYFPKNFPKDLLDK